MLGQGLVRFNENTESIAVKTVASYRRNLRSPVRGLWSGVITFDQAFDAFQSTVERNFAQAWMAGAKECGIENDELTETEKNVLNERVAAEIEHISEFLEAVETNSKKNGGQLVPLFNRLEMWVNRWDELFELGESYACADEKAVWVLGRTDKHCPSCVGFSGRVYRRSTWRDNDAMPRSQRLACRGYNCDCSLPKTDRPITKGRFPMRLLQ
jgi:hypothetical protein